jgi:hypothetical protein
MQVELFVVTIDSVLDKLLYGGGFQWKINGILVLLDVKEYCNFIRRVFESLDRVGDQALFGGFRV